MAYGFVARIPGRLTENAQLLRSLLEVVALLAIIAIGAAFFLSQRAHQERVTALNERIAAQEILLAEYRAKLNGASAEEAAARIDDLTRRLAEAQKNLNETKTQLASLGNQPRDPHRLYLGNSAIARVQDPKVDIEKKTITFPGVTSDVLLEINKSYAFQSWNLVCGGTQTYSAVKRGPTHEYSYSPLTCKIAGNR
jgi:hypothetical protein